MFAGISLFSIVVGSITILSLALLISAPKNSNISLNASVSVISGTLHIVTLSSAKIGTSSSITGICAVLPIKCL